VIGTIIGQSIWAMRGLDPVFQVLRTVPPLAWLPIALAAFRDSQPSAVFVIFITAIWPIIINYGGRHSQHSAGLPQCRGRAATETQSSSSVSHVAAAAPFIFTGCARRRSGVAGDCRGGDADRRVGIGFFIWDAWNPRGCPTSWSPCSHTS